MIVQTEDLRVSRASGRWTPHWRDILAALSLANLWFLKLWTGVLDHSVYRTYFQREAVSPERVWGLLLAVGILTIAYVPLLHLAGRLETGRKRAWLARLVLVSMIAPANGLRLLLSDNVPLMGQFLRYSVLNRVGVPGVWGVAVALGAAGAWVLWKNWAGAYRLVRFGALLVSPLALITTGHAVTETLRGAGGTGYTTSAVSQDGKPHTAAARRVVFLLFDEWDEQMTEEAAARGVALPALDRLRGESTRYMNAVSPSDGTMTAIPSLTVGRVVAEAKPAGDGELLLRYEGSQEFIPWSKAPTVFRRAHEAGRRVGIAGWYHPYCRVFAEVTDGCAWWPIWLFDGGKERGVAGQALYQTRLLFETSSLSPFGMPLQAQQHVEAYQGILEKARAMAADPEMDLVWVHFPIPHPPFVYDRGTGKFDKRNSLVSGYYDALALVDRSVGEVRRAMEASGVWERTVLILTSDHSLRTSGAMGKRRDTRVPLVVRSHVGGIGESVAKLMRTESLTKLIGCLLDTETKGIPECAESGIQGSRLHSGQ